MIPLFLTDIDGTLLVEGKVGEDDCAAIRAWKRQGGKFGFVTGRSEAFCRQLGEKYGIEPDVMVCDNGARTVVSTKPVSEAFIGSDETVAALEALIPYADKVYPFVTGVDGRHYFPVKRFGKDRFLRLQQIQAHLETFAYDADLEEVLESGFHVPGISLYVPDIDDIPVVLEAMRTATPALVWHQTSVDYIEAAKRDKAAGLAALLETGCYDPVYFVGDGTNDIPAFDMLENTYVIATADDSVKDHARMAVDSVAEAIERSI